MRHRKGEFAGHVTILNKQDPPKANDPNGLQKMLDCLKAN